MPHLPFSYWSTSYTDTPQEKDYILIDPEKGRMIASVARPESLPKRIPFYIWYQEEPPDAVLARLRPDGTWLRSTYRLEDDAIHWRWTGSDKEHTWHKVKPSDLPEWFLMMIQKTHDKMDVMEQKHHPDGSTE